MKILKFLLLVLLFAITSLNSYALQTLSTIGNPNNFGIKFPNGTQFYGNANKVVSISKQEFIVGPLLVTEVCIEFDQSHLQVRIYNSRVIPADKTSETIKKKIPETLSAKINTPNVVKKFDKETANMTTQQNIYKDYPTTTHAKTLEFIVPNITELNAFFEKITDDFNKIGNQTMNKKIYILSE